MKCFDYESLGNHQARESILKQKELGIVHPGEGSQEPQLPSNWEKFILWKREPTNCLRFMSVERSPGDRFWPDKGSVC